MNSGPGVKAAFVMGKTAAAAHVMVWESFIIELCAFLCSFFEAVGFRSSC